MKKTNHFTDLALGRHHGKFLKKWSDATKNAAIRKAASAGGMIKMSEPLFMKKATLAL
jgi:hypothetical protein